MDRILHLISFLENPYGVGSIRAIVGEDRGGGIIVPSKTSNQDLLFEGLNIVLKIFVNSVFRLKKFVVTLYFVLTSGF